MKYLLSAFYTTIAFFGYSQDFVNLDKAYQDQLQKNFIDLIDSTNIYENDANSTKLFYYTLVPKDSIFGTLVLLPSTWETVESVFNNNIELVTKAFRENIMTVVPSINYNLCLDSTSLLFLNTVLDEVRKKYAPPNRYVFGGFSLGAMNAIRYTELAYENDSLTAVKPAAVFGVDPPLDLVRLYHSFERSVQKNFSGISVYEANNYLQRMNVHFGGSPAEFPQIYIQHSMYSRSEHDGGNAQYLATVPVRIYCDPDIDWQLKNRRMDYYDMNALDQTAMINHLTLIGNENAEFINALGKGYRSDGRRHPHSWSLIDPDKCIEWIMNAFN